MKYLLKFSCVSKIFCIEIFLVIIVQALLLVYISHLFDVSQVNVVSETSGNEGIQRIVHFIVGQTDDRNATQHFPLANRFSLLNYLTILTARRHLCPEQLFVHFYEEPTSIWWQLAKNNIEMNITLMKTRLVTNIFGTPIHHHAHRSDILRLEILLRFGGIYLDTDVLTLRSFDPLLNISDVVAGYENGRRDFTGNAVLLAKTNAVFLRRIYDAYQNYDPTCFTCNSVMLIGKLAKIYSREVHVLPHESFYRLESRNATTFFKVRNINFAPDYATHFWNKLIYAKLNQLTPKRILNENFVAARLIRAAVGRNTLRELRRVADD